jgi:hypothetical protein
MATYKIVHNPNTMSLIPRPPSPQQQPSAASSSSVLDALPYVEQPDPQYEQHAISLIEAELAHANEQSEHPSLAGRLPPHSLLHKDVKNAPLASAAYASLLNGSASSKIHEHHRLHLANLDLHSAFGITIDKAISRYFYVVSSGG